MIVSHGLVRPPPKNRKKGDALRFYKFCGYYLKKIWRRIPETSKPNSVPLTTTSCIGQMRLLVDDALAVQSVQDLDELALPGMHGSKAAE